MKKMLLIGMIVGLSACSKTDDPSPPVTEAPLGIDVEISDRGALTTTFIEGDRLGLFLADAGEKSYRGNRESMNIPATYTTPNHGWAIAGNVKVSSPAVLFAYYPYRETGITDFLLPIESASQTDYLYSRVSSVSGEFPHARLKMKHALTSVRLLILRGNYRGVGTVSSVTASGIATTGTINLRTGKVEVVKEGTETYRGSGVLPQDRPLSVAFRAIPKAIDKVAVTVTIDDVPFLLELSGGGWGTDGEADYMLALNQEKRTLSLLGNERIDGWEDGGRYVVESNRE